MMDYQKIGVLIYELRKEKNMTQKQVAQLMNISDKTISKWVCNSHRSSGERETAESPPERG